MAHASNVSSLVLGKASGRLLATGGDDCRVNLWSVNKPNCIMVRLGRRGGAGSCGRGGAGLGAAVGRVRAGSGLLFGHPAPQSLPQPSA